MIPHDQLITVGFKILFAEFDEADQRVRVNHGTGAGVVDQTADLAVADDLINLIDLIGNDIGVPLCATARIDDDIDVIGDLGLGHFLQIINSHCSL